MKRSLNATIANVFSVSNKNDTIKNFFISVNIIRAASIFKGLELDQFCRRIFSHPKLPSNIKFIHKDLNRFCELPCIGFKDSNSELTWLSHLFNHNREALSFFSRIKKEIEANILTSQIEMAQQQLNALHEKCGYSFWEIEMRSCLEKYINKKSNQKYISGIRNAVKHQIEDFVLQQILFKHQSKRFETFSQNLVGILDEMRDSSGDDMATHYADVYSSYFLPLEFDKRISINNRRLFPATHISCIDQYLLFKKFLSDKIAHGSGLNSRELIILEKVANDIDDDELINLINISKGVENEADPLITNCIEVYTNGSYLDASSKIHSLIKKDVRYISLIDILARSNIYIDSHERKCNTLLDEITQAFKSVLTSDSDSVTQKLAIESIATTFNHSSICSTVLFHLYNAIKNNKYKREIARKNCLIQKSFCTPYMSGSDSRGIHRFDNAPTYRKIKHRDISSLSKIEIEEHFENYKKECKIKSDYIADYADHLIINNELLKCAQFTVDTFIENNLTHQFLPIKELIDSIESQTLEELSIDIPILYSIYSKTISKDRDEEKTEAYEDFISNFNTHLPSQIFKTSGGLSPKIAYFLKNVCVISNMDSSEDFESTEEIKRERVVILDLLRNTSHGDELVTSERNSILDEISFEGLKTKFDTSKIFVDVDSIKNEKFERYKFLYDLYQDAISNEKSISTEDEYTVIDDYNNEKTVIPSSNTTDVLSQIYREIVADFVSNENYGLDKYLSADIRHGIFVSQIRSGIEKYGIITDVNENGNYEKNRIIDQKYPLLIPQIKNKLTEDMCEFSRSFDSVLNSANSIFKVVTEINDKSNGMFNFMPMFDNIDGLRSAIQGKTSFEEFFDSIIGYMWKLTLDALNEVKKYLNEELKPQLTETVNNLESSLINHKKNVPLKELFECVTHMKASIVEELDRVTSWLNIAEMNESNIYDVKSVVYACKKTFESIFFQYQIHIGIEDYTRNVAFTYKDAKPLMTSIITALDNANSYGNGEVSLSINEADNITNISITNHFHFDSNQDIVKLRKLIKRKMTDSNPMLAKVEGGTGIYKIYNLLKNSSDRFTLNVKITDDGYFTLSIGVKNEHTNN